MREEKDIKKEKKADEKGSETEEKGSLRKAVSKYSPMALKGVVVAFATTAVLAVGCTSDDKKTDKDSDTDAPADVVDEDAATDALEDVVLDSEEDVDEGDGPVRLDSFEEDVRRDAASDTGTDVSEDSESDAVVDSESDPTDDVVPGSCGPVPDSTTAYLTPGESEIVGNVTVTYLGMSGSSGRYEVSCGTLVDTITIPERSAGVVGLGAGYSAELSVNTVRSWGSNLTITIRASP